MMFSLKDSVNVSKSAGNFIFCAVNVIRGIDNSILEFGASHFVEILLHGRKVLDILSNTNILNATIDFLIKGKKFLK